MMSLLIDVMAKNALMAASLMGCLFCSSSRHNSELGFGSVSDSFFMIRSVFFRSFSR